MSTPDSPGVGATTGRRTRRDLSIEALRGLALVLMVAGHVIGKTADRGMQVSDGSVWRYLYLGLSDLRMPLFTFVSGYVFALRPLLTRAGYPDLVVGKARRVLVPMVTVGTLLFLTEVLVPGTNAKPDPADWWRVYVFGFEHLWFLKAIFWVYLVAGALEVFRVLGTVRGWYVAMAGSLVLLVVVRIPAPDNVFSLNEAVYLLPFFLLGYGISRHRPGETRMRAALVAVAFLCVFVARLAMLFHEWSPAPAVGGTVRILVGLSGVVFLYLQRGKLRRFRLLVWLGPYSFGVYLLHPFGAASSRMALHLLGVHDLTVVFVVALTAGLLAPILFQVVFRRSRLVRTLILGEKVTPPRRPEDRTTAGARSRRSSSSEE